MPLSCSTSTGGSERVNPSHRLGSVAWCIAASNAEALTVATSL